MMLRVDPDTGEKLEMSDVQIGLLVARASKDGAVEAISGRATDTQLDFAINRIKAQQEVGLTFGIEAEASRFLNSF